MKIQEILDIAREAGRAILGYFKTDLKVSVKEDRSPLTEADRTSHRIIEAALRARFPEVPCVSEEGEIPAYGVRKKWERFWLVDPLDGTKEFIRGIGEFTVNIALVQNGRPVLGVIYVPVAGVLYYAGLENGAWKKEGESPPAPIRVRTPSEEESLIAVESRFHHSKKVEMFVSRLPVQERRPVGSSLKFCAIAEGKADLYVRPGAIWEWDTAAGQAILERAGGTVVDFEGNPVRYNKESLRNTQILAVGGGPGTAERVLKLLHSILS